MLKKGLLFLLLLLFSDVASAETIPVPTSQQSFTYDPIAHPVISTDPSQAKPIGIGSIAEGGGILNLRIEFYNFEDVVDIYLGIYAPSIDSQNIYLMNENYSLQPLSMGLIPWKIGVKEINESLLGDIQASLLPSGQYFIYLAVTPHGDSSRYYLWTTSFFIPDYPPEIGKVTSSVLYHYFID
jgi:hypothetical protein